MVSVGRILRDYRDAGSVNGLLALWGFVDDSTFLTKAGHVGVVYRLRGVDYEGLSHPQRQALVHRFEAALRLLDEHCRVYQYLLKRTVGPFVAMPCEAPIANEAIQRRAAYLNGRRQDLYDLSLYLVLLYEAPHVVRRRTEFAGSGRRPARRSAPGCRRTRHSSFSNRSWTEPSGRSTTRRRRSRSRSGNSVPCGWRSRRRSDSSANS